MVKVMTQSMMKYFLHVSKYFEVNESHHHHDDKPILDK